MAESILATKLYVPPSRPKAILRPRLIERLNKGIDHKLILISASAGFGKTTLVSEWVSTCGRPVAWLSLDESDSDLSRFLTYVIAALQTIQPALGENLLAAMQTPQPPPVEALLTSLLNEISALPDHPSTGSEQGLILVLDDYHVIDSNLVDDALTFLVERMPPQMHLVIATREDPQLPLSRLRVRGQLTELRAVDLRFTPIEAAEFLNQMMSLNLSAEDIAVLDKRTEGWIAGLQLAAISMQGHQDSASFIKSFTGSHRFVLDYLIEEVLGQQSEKIQAFLLRTSILDQMCGSLCDAVLLDPATSGQEILEQLERANLFIVPLDNERRWYRYHHLFGDLLRQRLGRPQELAQYHLRASEWCEANNDLPKAFHHALAANDFERAARLAEIAWQGMERNFQTLAWLGWVKKLPDAAICSRPWLCVEVGWAYSDVGELEPSETFLQNAERALASKTDQEEFKSIPGIIALIRAGNAQIDGDLVETVRYAELSVRLAPENDSLTRAQAAITLGFTRWATGDVEASLHAMQTWVDDMQKLGNQMYVLASAFVVADMQVILGRLGEAEKTLHRTIRKAEAFGHEAEALTAHQHLGLAMIAHERGDDMVATQRLQIAAELGQRSTLIDWAHRWNLAQARLKESDGELDSALRCLDDAERGYIKNPIPIMQPIAAHKARVHLRQGRLDKAQAWVRERGLSVQDEASYLGEYEHLTLVRTRLAERSFEGVNDLLERLLALAESQKRMGSVIEILLTQALVHQAQGNHSESLAALERTLTLTEPEGYIRVYVDEGKPMQLLISDFQLKNPNRAHPLHGYVDRILNFFPQQVEDTTKSKVVNPKHLHLAQVQVSEIPDPLSERELEVLQLLRGELSGPEIAEKLIVSLNTLRTHTKNIFNKLGVTSRRAAVRRAEELDLF